MSASVRAFPETNRKDPELRPGLLHPWIQALSTGGGRPVEDGSWSEKIAPWWYIFGGCILPWALPVRLPLLSYLPQCE